MFERTNIEILDNGGITYTIETRRYAESGISIVNDHVGTFYISVETSWLVNDYTIIIEQNVDSIPEFPSWVILPLFVVATSIIILIRKTIVQKRKIKKGYDEFCLNKFH